jgi:hypothetical protein
VIWLVSDLALAAVASVGPVSTCLRLVTYSLTHNVTTESRLENPEGPG